MANTSHRQLDGRSTGRRYWLGDMKSSTRSYWRRSHRHYRRRQMYLIDAKRRRMEISVLRRQAASMGSSTGLLFWPLQAAHKMGEYDLGSMQRWGV